MLSVAFEDAYDDWAVAKIINKLRVPTVDARTHR